MAEDANKKNEGAAEQEGAPEPLGEDEATGRNEDRSGISDFVRRAVSAGVGAASRSKDDIVRVAAGEVRNWLDRLNLHEELAKALAKLVIEVKTEIKFRPNEEGKLVPETTNDVKLKSPK
jgi:hypothetical protein